MKKIFIPLLLSAFTILNMTVMATQPYDSIKQVDYQPYFLPNSWQVLSELNSVKGSVFVDVNSDQNAASRYIAQNVGDNVQVYAISTWDDFGSYQTFLSNVIQEETTDIITPIRMGSEEASFSLNIIADVVYLNTSDSDSLSYDLGLWLSHLSPTGVIVGDNWNYPDIEFAIACAAINYGLSITTSGTFWVLQR